MIATLIRTQKMPSKYGGFFHYAFFKGEDGKSYSSCISERCKNFKNWKPFIGKEIIMLDGLNLKDNKTIDADSIPKEIYAIS